MIFASTRIIRSSLARRASSNRSALSTARTKRLISARSRRRQIGISLGVSFMVRAVCADVARKGSL